MLAPELELALALGLAHHALLHLGVPSATVDSALDEARHRAPA